MITIIFFGTEEMIQTYKSYLLFMNNKLIKVKFIVTTFDKLIKDNKENY